MFYRSPTNFFERTTLVISSGILLLILLTAREARSAGFFLQEQSPAASGRAFAGDAAAAEDASTIFYNPAGMTELRGGLQGEAGVYLIAPEATLSDRGSTASTGGGAAAPVGGLSQDQGFNPQASGDLYVAGRVTDGWWLGLGVTVPFGLRDHYQLNYFGRYDSTKTELRTVDVAPSTGVAVTRWLSVGAGLDIQRADAKFEQALVNPGGMSPSTDGLFDADGGDWGVGFNVGVLVKPIEDLRVGITYRSGVDHKVKGNSQTEIPSVLSSAKAVTGHFNLPDITSVGVAYDYSPSITLLAQADYYGWRRFKQIRLSFADGTQQVIPENFRNSVGFSLGGEWRLAPAWTLRSGIEWDQTPTPSDGRSTAIPDSDRTWLALGVSYEVNDRIGLDLSYAHDFNNTASINRTNSVTSLGTVATTKGVTSDTSNVVGMAVRVRY